MIKIRTSSPRGLLTAADGRSVNGLVPGRPAPDALVRDGEGHEVRLADLWPAAPKATALVFFRHFG